MEPQEGAEDPYSRPARRTQWLVSALAHHYGLDRGVENEIVVLATGLDQYLQEVFHHLDCAGAGSIPGADFRALCRVLGLRVPGAALPPRLSFRQFHARLCGFFSAAAGSAAPRAVPRLPLGRESEHIETQIRLRSPRRRRGPRAAPGGGEGSPPAEGGERSPALRRAEHRIAALERESAGLRELVEDLRAALQSSDARCLALQVGLWKSNANHKEEGTCFEGSKSQLTDNDSQAKCLQSVLKEVELIRSSRDEQIEEAIQFNQELERELKSSREALLSLEDSNRNLKREQAEMRKKVEEARRAVLNSLGKVKELEVKANEVPRLQLHIQQLEAELQRYRSEAVILQVPCGSSPEQDEGAASPEGRCCPPVVHHDRRSPTGGAGISENGLSTKEAARASSGEADLPSVIFFYSKEDKSSSVKLTVSNEVSLLQSGDLHALTKNQILEDQLFRAVEGQAASDEEEEKWTGHQPCQVDTGQRTPAKLPCCGSGCNEKMWKKLMSYMETINTDSSEPAPAELAERITQLTEQLQLNGHEEKKLETNMEEVEGPVLGELQQRVEETELLKVELQMLETERVRLSLLEEKLMDVLQLLQQLRDLNISKRALGKILLSTLESCRDPQPGKAHLFEVLDTLYHKLTACGLLQSQPLEAAQSRQSLSNPLVISC